MRGDGMSMIKKKAIFSFVAVTVLSVTLLLSKTNLEAASNQQNLNIKKQMEQNDAEILKEKDLAGEKARIANKSTESNIDIVPVSEPDEYKKPYQLKLEAERHGLIRKANSIWTIKGIIEPNQIIWNEMVGWSGVDDNGKKIIGTLVENGQVFNGKYDGVYTSPKQDIGDIYITDVKGSLLFIKADTGVTGNFNIDSHEWHFDN
jgi:hypothetical protein